MSESKTKKLQIEYVPLSSLKPNPRNPRVASTDTILQLSRSIKEFGWTNPILAQRSTGLVIAGHQRFKAAQFAKVKTVPVIFLELDDVKALAYNITDNKLAELTSWDPGKLPQLLDELSSNLADWILSHMQKVEHDCYVEPFGGSAAILVRKPRVRAEVYNDINRFVCEFFQCIRDDPMNLLSKLAFMPNARQLFYDIQHKFNEHEEPEDLYQRAAEWYYIQHQSFAGKWGGGWAHGKAHSTDFKPHVFSRLIKVAERLRYVQIENRDFRQIFKTYDGESTLFYVDPPYWGLEDYYKVSGNFTLKDHQDLARILHHLQGKAVVSYYPCKFVDEAYKGWRRVTKETYAWSKGMTLNDPDKRRAKRTELLLMNF
jgi:DNA adenine methylase